MREAGRERVSANRICEARATGSHTLAVGCPFCMIMLSDGAKAGVPEMQVRDVAEIVAENLNPALSAPPSLSPLRE